MSVRIYHNPRCSKSRQTLQLLRDRGIEPEIVEYLKTPPSEAEIRALLRSLGVEPMTLVRRREPEFAEVDLDPAAATADAVAAAIHRHPKLLERPVVVNGRRAAIGRPPEAVLEIL